MYSLSWKLLLCCLGKCVSQCLVGVVCSSELDGVVGVAPASEGFFVFQFSVGLHVALTAMFI